MRASCGRAPLPHRAWGTKPSGACLTRSCRRLCVCCFNQQTLLPRRRCAPSRAGCGATLVADTGAKRPRRTTMFSTQQGVKNRTDPSSQTAARDWGRRRQGPGLRLRRWVRGPQASRGEVSTAELAQELHSTKGELAKAEEALARLKQELQTAHANGRDSAVLVCELTKARDDNELLRRELSRRWWPAPAALAACSHPAAPARSPQRRARIRGTGGTWAGPGGGALEMPAVVI